MSCRIFFNPTALNEVLKEVRPSASRIATMREKNEDGTEEWFSVFVATDQDTGKPRKTEKGDYIFNVKVQRKRDDAGPVLVDDRSKDGDAWTD